MYKDRRVNLIKLCLFFSLIISEKEKCYIQSDKKTTYFSDIFIALCNYIYENEIDFYNLDNTQKEKIILLIINILKSQKKFYKEEVKLEQLKFVFFNKDNTRYFFEKANIELKKCLKYKLNILTYFDEDYPENLKKMKKSPLIIYYKGTFPSNSKLENTTSIIGSRVYKEENSNFILNEFNKILDYYDFYNLTLYLDGYNKNTAFGLSKISSFIIPYGFENFILNLKEFEKNKFKEILRNNGYIISRHSPSKKFDEEDLFEEVEFLSYLSKSLIGLEIEKFGKAIQCIYRFLNRNKNVYILDIKSINNKNFILHESFNSMILSFEHDIYPSHDKLLKSKRNNIKRLNIDKMVKRNKYENNYKEKINDFESEEEFNSIIDSDYYDDNYDEYKDYKNNPYGMDAEEYYWYLEDTDID